MAGDLCTSRLRKEFKELRKNPVENIRACPKENNILEWHYVIEGAKKTDYEGGYYHGVVIFPREYPYKPPSIQMYTPNGRFKVSTRLCLSMSDFHPETWNPMWSVGTILMGLYSFMQEDTPTHGSIVSSSPFKRRAAIESLEFNCHNKLFCELFPDLVELNESRRKERAIVDSSAETSMSTSTTFDNQLGGGGAGNEVSWPAILGVLAAIIACTGALLAMSL